MSTPCSRPHRRPASSVSSAPPKPGARAAPPRRRCCFAGGFLGQPCPPHSWRRSVKASRCAGWRRRLLNAMTAGQSEREPRDVRFGTTRGSLSTFLLSRSWRYRLAELNNHLTNQTDVLTVPLPERLWFLYPVLRLPLWAWRHCSQTRQYKDLSA